MKVIIAGSRDIGGIGAVEKAIKYANFEITEVVSGGAKGIDKVGEYYARENNIPVVQFLPDWKTHGKAAGPLRNRQMAEYADALIAVWDGISRGTENMINEAKRLKLKVFVYLPDRDNP